MGGGGNGLQPDEDSLPSTQGVEALGPGPAVKMQGPPPPLLPHATCLLSLESAPGPSALPQFCGCSLAAKVLQPFPPSAVPSHGAHGLGVIQASCQAVLTTEGNLIKNGSVGLDWKVPQGHSL